MAKRKYRYRNRFDIGGIKPIQGVSISDLVEIPTIRGSIPNSIVLPSLSTIPSVVSKGLSSGATYGMTNTGVTLTNKLMNPNGNSTKVGNVLSTVGSAASTIPGVGGLIGAGVNLAGGLFNTMFGSNINEEAVAQVESNIANQKNMGIGASTTSDFLNMADDYRNLAHIETSDIGSDGWFSNKASNKAKELNWGIDTANRRALANFTNTANNVNTNTINNLLANYAAYGGPITMRYTGLMSPFGNQFKDGGGIHIKPENRGKFTALKKRTGKSASWFKEHGTPAQRKMATFALNARKWKHDDGGPLNPYSAGALVDAIYKNSKGDEYLGEPSHHYDVTIPEEEADRLGYHPNERGHRDDRVKKPAHPTHPSRGKWKSFEEFELTDIGMENPNYTLFGLNDGGQDPQAVMTYNGGVVLPEITVTPKETYIMNPYDNIKIFDKGGYLTNKKSSSRRLDNNYKEGEIYDITEGEVKLLKELGYEFEYV